MDILDDTRTCNICGSVGDSKLIPSYLISNNEFDSDFLIVCHESCATLFSKITHNEESDSPQILQDISSNIINNLIGKCSYCELNGAPAACINNNNNKICNKKYHLNCRIKCKAKKVSRDSITDILCYDCQIEFPHLLPIDADEFNDNNYINNYQQYKPKKPNNAQNKKPQVIDLYTSNEKTNAQSNNATSNTNAPAYSQPGSSNPNAIPTTSQRPDNHDYYAASARIPPHYGNYYPPHYPHPSNINYNYPAPHAAASVPPQNPSVNASTSSDYRNNDNNNRIAPHKPLDTASNDTLAKAVPVNKRDKSKSPSRDRVKASEDYKHNRHSRSRSADKSRKSRDHKPRDRSNSRNRDHHTKHHKHRSRSRSHSRDRKSRREINRSRSRSDSRSGRQSRSRRDSHRSHKSNSRRHRDKSRSGSRSESRSRSRNKHRNRSRTRSRSRDRKRAEIRRSKSPIRDNNNNNTHHDNNPTDIICIPLPKGRSGVVSPLLAPELPMQRIELPKHLLKSSTVTNTNNINNPANTNDNIISIIPSSFKAGKFTITKKPKPDPKLIQQPSIPPSNETEAGEIVDAIDNNDNTSAKTTSNVIMSSSLYNPAMLKIVPTGFINLPADKK